MKRSILLSIVTFVVYFSVLFFTGWKHKYAFPIFIIGMYIIGFFLNGKKEILISFLPFLILFVLTPVIEGGSLTFIIILYAIFLPLSLFLAHYIKNKNFFIKSIFPVIILLFSMYGFMNYLSYVRNFNSRTNTIAPEITLVSKNKDTLYLDKIKDKIIVLDFWNSTCGICFKKFPDYEKVYLEYKNNSNVVLYSVNIPYSNESIDSNIKLAKEKVNYKFKNLFAKSSNLTDSLGFNSYPHLVILKDGKVRYNGQSIFDPKIKAHNVRKEIDRLLNE